MRAHRNIVIHCQRLLCRARFDAALVHKISDEDTVRIDSRGVSDVEGEEEGRVRVRRKLDVV